MVKGVLGLIQANDGELVVHGGPTADTKTTGNSQRLFRIDHILVRGTLGPTLLFATASLGYRFFSFVFFIRQIPEPKVLRIALGNSQQTTQRRSIERQHVNASTVGLRIVDLFPNHWFLPDRRLKSPNVNVFDSLSRQEQIGWSPILILVIQ